MPPLVINIMLCSNLLHYFNMFYLFSRFCQKQTKKKVIWMQISLKICQGKRVLKYQLGFLCREPPPSSHLLFAQIEDPAQPSFLKMNSPSSLSLSSDVSVPKSPVYLCWTWLWGSYCSYCSYKEIEELLYRKGC